MRTFASSPFRRFTFTMLSSAAMLIAPVAAGAFNPNDGATAAQLPSTAAITERPGNATYPQLVGYQVAQAQPTVLPEPYIPPVDPAVAAKAQEQLQATPLAGQGYIAPVPAMAEAPAAPVTEVVATAPVEPHPQAALPAPEPLAAAPLPPAELAQAPAVEPTEKLSTESKKILSGVPSKIGESKTKGGKLNVSRMSPQVQSLANDAQKVETYDAVGVSIKVQRQGLDTNYELNRAYIALMGGDNAEAINVYKNILSTEPTNEDALFGLASVYHRTGALDKARPFYAALLKANPNHREGLNNFMALISDEAPQEALAELERLEQRNPEFSPIPAQQALVLKKLGFMDQAREKMMRAIELAPENLTYKYNLAVMLDTQGHYVDASALYRLLIDASLKGEKVPATVEALQKRLNYIAVAPVKTALLGG